MRGIFWIVWIIGLGGVVSSCLNVDSDKTLSFEEQWKQDTTAIGVFLRKENIPALKDASGVSFIIDSLGSGFPPKVSSSIRFKYTGRLLSGQIFEQNTVTADVEDMITGMQIGLSLMPKGSKARIYIPSGFAYGNTTVNAIPANSNLIFEIQLLDVIITEVEKQRLASDTVAIDEYLTNNSLPFTADKSGLRYNITTLGNGPIPTLYDKVRIRYTGKILVNEIVFFSGTNGPTDFFDSRVINYIYGFQAGLTKMPVGSKATLYVPSGLGFGNQITQGSGVQVPANSNLSYEMELLEIVE